MASKDQMPPIIPFLIPINKKKEPVQQEDDNKNEIKNQKPIPETEKYREPIPLNMKVEREPRKDGKVKREEIQQRQKEKQEEKVLGRKKNNQKEEENRKSKELIQSMLTKLSVKGISQELYPASNETIRALISELQREIEELKNEAQKKQNSLQSNPSSLHLKSELANLNKAINRCQTNKKLYLQNINFRQKVLKLQIRINELQREKNQLNIKFRKDIQKAQQHQHNLPCEREKELKQELIKITEELKIQKEMRQNLQGKNQSIVYNFQRLYEEADKARIIVNNKLREIQQRQRKLPNQNSDIQYSERSSQIGNAQEPHDQTRKSPIQSPNQDKMNGQTARKAGVHQKNPINKANSKQIKEQIQKKLTLEEQLKRMKSNQAKLSKRKE